MSMQRIGRYEIEETLGRGAMGVVYLARDPLIDRQVALKTLRVDLDAEHVDEFRERFVREARAAGRLNHPGIVTVHDVGEDPETGLMYIAMEYIQGRDLKQLLASGHRFRPSEVARIAADVAVALGYAHSLGVVHRDIKPANIILADDGSAKITDFGIARLETSNLTVDGQFIGTPNFMSPEQITGKKVDGRADIFSLGVLLFTLLTGQRPFAGDTMHEVTLRIVQEPSPIPSTLGEDIPAALNPIVLKCLEKDPERRFQTGDELAKVLGAVARSLVQRAPSDTGRTNVHQPDLATRIHVETPPIAQPQSRRAALVAGVRQWWGALHPPEWMRWEVESRWAWSILAVSGLLLLVAILGLRSRIDNGPFLGPSESATRNLNTVVGLLQTAGARLRAGDPAQAQEAVHSALDQVPTSRAGRTLAREIRIAIEAERTSEANQRRVADLVTEGRQLYRNRRYRDAGDRFREALDLDPMNEIATDYLELAEERMRTARVRSARSSTSRASSPDALAVEPAPETTPVAGIARITLTFDSPISSGAISVTLDGESLVDIPFDFSSTGFLGFKRKGRGNLKRVILTPSGRHTVGVQLVGSKQGAIGSARFDRDLAPDSHWTLRVDLPDKNSDLNFFLVKAAR